MIIRHVENIKDTNLEYHKDERGTIVDLFFNENINHVAKINSKPNVIRGNHYHKETTQLGAIFIYSIFPPSTTYGIGGVKPHQRAMILNDKII